MCAGYAYLRLAFTKKKVEARRIEFSFKNNACLAWQNQTEVLEHFFIIYIASSVNNYCLERNGDDEYASLCCVNKQGNRKVKKKRKHISVWSGEVPIPKPWIQCLTGKTEWCWSIPHQEMPNATERASKALISSHLLSISLFGTPIPFIFHRTQVNIILWSNCVI